jgi:hypothetical protein
MRPIGARIIAGIGIEAGAGRERAGIGEQDGVAVGRGARDLAGGDGAAGAAAIIDYDWLAERRAHLVGHDAGDDAGAAAGREGDDEGDGPGRIIAGGGRKRRERPGAQ